MIAANIAKTGLRGVARPLARQPRATNIRTVITKSDGPDGTTSTLKGGSRTYATIGGLVLAVAGSYGYMMGKPHEVVRNEASPASITERGSADLKRK